MKYINKIRNFYIPFDYPKFALVISIAAFAFAASSHNTPCLSAQSTCSVGSDNEFTGNISLKGGTAYKSTLDASGITADRTLTIPDNNGTLALTSDITPPSYTPDAPFLKVDGTGTAVVGSATVDAPFVSVDASGQLDSSATLTADSPFLSADASGQIQAGTIGAASTPLKSDANSQIVASDLDITTDITPGSALQEIRVNSGGTALEYYTPSGGSPDSRIVAQGSTVASSTYTGMEMICWYGQHTLDKDKNYKLIFNGGGYNIALSGDSNYWRPQQGDCTSGGGSYFSNILNYWLVGNGNLFAGNTYSTSSTFCRLVQSTNSNTSSAKTSNLSGEITLRPWRVTNGYGFFANYDAMGVVYNAINSPDQIQTAVGGCQDANINSFADITGLDMQLEGNGTSSGRGWVLYEYDY